MEIAGTEANYGKRSNNPVKILLIEIRRIPCSNGHGSEYAATIKRT